MLIQPPLPTKKSSCPIQEGDQETLPQLKPKQDDLFISQLPVNRPKAIAFQTLGCLLATCYQILSKYGMATLQI